MPGRPSVRANRAAASAGAKSQPAPAQERKTRATSTRSSTNNVEIPDEGTATALRSSICTIFGDAQRGITTQRKSAVSLRKIQELCCYETPNPRKHAFANSAQDYDEQDFSEEIARCVLRILPVKKSEPTGDKLIRFVGFFLKYASDKDTAIFQSANPDVSENVPETPTTRLVSHLLDLLLQTVQAKDKNVRYRATQIISHIVNTLDSIDDELFNVVRLALLRRLRDKESNVRVQAVLGLGRLAEEGDDNDDEQDSDDEDAGGVLNKLLQVLQHDPSADVRRALLLNLPMTPSTLPFILERARDLDGATRRALYARLLPTLGDFRHLSLTHREKLLRWGLRDRDENVRKATAKLFRERWIEDCAISHKPQAAEGGEEQRVANVASAPNLDALLELLERIDVVNSGVETGIAHQAMKQFWDGRPDYREHVSFEDPYFDELTAESMFVARSFNQYCKDSGDAKLESMREDKMPEVTKFAFLLQRHIAKLIEGVELVAVEPDNAEAEENTLQQEFCVEQMLHVALTFDYSDEMGRRKMFSVMREALALAALPEECTKLVAEVLRLVCGTGAAGETEFCSIVLEAIAEVHDTISGDDPSQNNDGAEDSFHSAQSDVTTMPIKAKNQNGEEHDEEKAFRELMVNMKCVHIAQCMLQNVQCDLEKNSHLVTMLNNLIIPAVRSLEVPLRERGLVCLGLCCLLSKNLADENLVLFLHIFSKGTESMQVIIIQIIADLITAHPALLAEAVPVNDGLVAEPNTNVKAIYKIFSKSLRAPDNSVQSNGCIALSKLMLAGTIQDQDLLKQLVLAYFDPETQSNPQLRQALSYFLPVFCHSKRQNAETMARVAIGVIHAIAERADDLDEEEEMVGMNLVVAQLCDWTDPRKCVPLASAATTSANDDIVQDELDGHAVLAEEALEKLLAPGCNKEERKHYLSIFGKLYIGATVPVQHLRTLHSLLDEALASRAASEASARNALSKLQAAIDKLLQHANDEDKPESSTEQGTGEVEVKSADTPQHVADDTVVTPDAEEADELDAGDMTMLTKPDYEGTVFGDYDDEDDEDMGLEEEESEEVDVTTGLARRHVEDSLVESLLDDTLS